MNKVTDEQIARARKRVAEMPGVKIKPPRGK
jgi:hypothetical protein